MSVENPISANIWEESFVSPADGTRQTYLAAEFCKPAPETAPLLVINLHGEVIEVRQPTTASGEDE